MPKPSRITRSSLLAGVLLAAPAIGPALAWDGRARLEARGHEPEWRLTLEGTTAVLDSLAPDLRFTSDALRREPAGVRPVLTGQSGGRTLRVAVDETWCVDTMTGMPFPLTITLALDERNLSGCGGRTMDLLTGPWRVIEVAGEAPPAGPVPTLEFSGEGRVAGRAGCNRYTGTFTLTGEGLTFSPLAATRMACPEPAMAFEQRFFEVLRRVTRVSVAEGGRLVLLAGDDAVMRLDRPR